MPKEAKFEEKKLELFTRIVGGTVVGCVGESTLLTTPAL